MDVSVNKFDHLPDYELNFLDFVDSELGKYMISCGIILAPLYIVYKKHSFVFNPYLHLEDNLKVIMYEAM